MANISVKKPEDSGFTLLSNDFIDYHMPGANPAFVPVYIYILRNPGPPVSTEDMAERFSMLESDIIKALKYWDTQGLIKFSQDGGEIDITILTPKKKARPKESKAGAIQPAAFSKPPRYNPIELEMYKNDYTEIAELFSYGEKALGKLLSDGELSTLYSFYEWLRLPMEVIYYLLDYCTANGHRRMKYIEAVAIDWAQNGINSAASAKEHLNIFNGDYRQILSALGISGRNPAPKEIEFMDKWLEALSLELVLEACDKAIIATGKPQLTYVDKIITGWKEQKVSTLSDVKRVESEFREKEVKPEPSKKEMPKRKNRFTNYEQHVRDYTQIEKLESEYLLNKLKGDSNE